MSEAKFTKGPWVVGDYNNLRGVNQNKYSSICVNVSMTLGHDKSNSEFTANAHLIAAAPEMYNLLERLTSHDNCKKDIIHLLGEADNLLAKARGEKC